MELTQMYLTEEERVNFLKGMVRMARIDGVVEEEERVFFRNLLTPSAIRIMEFMTIGTSYKRSRT